MTWVIYDPVVLIWYKNVLDILCELYCYQGHKNRPIGVLEASLNCYNRNITSQTLFSLIWVIYDPVGRIGKKSYFGFKNSNFNLYFVYNQLLISIQM
eukprot:sb/3478961/